MNERQTSMHTTNSRTQPRARRKQPGGFTQQQVLILILVGILGSTLLAGTALIVFSMEKAPPAAVSSGPAAELSPFPIHTMPPTWTAESIAAQNRVTATAHGPTLPPLPAPCAQQGTEAKQAVITRVLDANTLEAQVDGEIFQVSFAGIAVLSTEASRGGDDHAVQRILELTEGKPVLLVTDASAASSSIRMPRYIFAGGRFINYELLREGLAQVSTEEASTCLSFFQSAEDQARAEHAGLWIPTPIPTRTFVPFVTLDPFKDGCDCSKRYACSDFRTHEQAQSCYNACNDYHSQLDGDRDGIACEGLP